jgi:creatinine amidohydrolase/Fe(II)-dependent formamide hydrolase-like protein
VAALSENGTLGDPTRASVEHGERYWEVAIELVLEQIAAAEDGQDGAHTRGRLAE